MNSFTFSSSATASQMVNLIRTAVVVTAVSAMSIGAVSLPHGSAQTAATTVQPTAHASHQVQTGNERWE